MQVPARGNGRTDDGRKVITIAHPEQSSGELKILCGYPLLSVAMHNYVKYPAGNHVTGYEKWIIKKKYEYDQHTYAEAKAKKIVCLPFH